MAELAQLESALVKADAAGDTDGARMLASEIRRMRTTTATPVYAGQDVPRSRSIVEGVKTGLGDPIYGLGQIAEQIPGVAAARRGVASVLDLPEPKSMTQLAQEREAEYQRGRQAAGREGVDVARIAGNVANPVNWLPGAAMGAVPKTIGQAVLTGAKVGGATAAMQPTVQGEEGVDLAAEKVTQALTGAAAGGATSGLIHGGLQTGRTIKEAGKEFSHYFTKEGYKPIAQQYLRQQIGEAQLPEVRARLLAAVPNLPARAPAPGAAGPTLPASPMTAAEAVSDISAGSPVQAMQKIVYQTPGGPSKVGGDIQREALAAQVAARAEANAATAPMRDQALQAANAQGGVKVNTIIRDIAKMETNPDWRASEVVKKTLENVREKLAELKDPTWRVDARDLYTVRKEIGNVIERNAKESANWDKRLSAKLQNDIQDKIDNAIEQAGGKGWRDYLSTYSKMLGKIEKDVSSKEAMYAPLQKTVVQRGANVAEGVLPGGGGPAVLWRPYTVAKWVPRMRAEVIEPKVDAYMAEIMRDAPRLGQALMDQPISARQQMVKALIERGQMAAPAIAGYQAGRP